MQSHELREESSMMGARVRRHSCMPTELMANRSSRESRRAREATTTRRFQWVFF
jgi:hypothetical protein